MSASEAKTAIGRDCEFVNPWGKLVRGKVVYAGKETVYCRENGKTVEIGRDINEVKLL